MDSVLVVEDTESLRQVLCAVLSSEGFHAVGAESGEQGLELLSQNSFSLVLSDLRLPGIDGIEFVKRSKSVSRQTPIIVMTAYGSIPIAVEAMKNGAADFITKPFEPATLCETLRQVAKQGRVIERKSRLRERQLVTDSPAMRAVLDQARRVSPLGTPVLILGESGTGKDLLARLIHQNSPRAADAFVPVNCGSLPSELMESEFFGHEAGSFTGATEERKGLFEVADRGTIFLDEICNMPLALQMKLLRTIQESEIRRVGSSKFSKVDVRIISATNSPIEERVKDGSFREDLFYRLGVVIIEIPPLRKRPDDIPLLTNYFLKTLSHELGIAQPLVTKEARMLLGSYDWPGNVRELENCLERALVLNDGPIRPDTLLISVPEISSEAPACGLVEISKDAARRAEFEAIRSAMAKAKGNKSRAAKLLSVSYKTLLSKLREMQALAGS